MKGAYRLVAREAFLEQLSGGPFTSERISERLGLSYGHASRLCRKMEAEGMLREEEPKRVKGSPGRSGLRGFEPARLALSSRGRRLIRVVLCGGAFDILHPGHIYFLRRAREQGDALVAVLARDQAVMGSKASPPVFSLDERLGILSSLRDVDLAIPGSEGYFDTLKRVSPDVVFLGKDQEADLRRVTSWRGESARPEIIICRRRKEGYSTSGVVGKIKAR